MSGLCGHEKSRYAQAAVAMAKTEVDEKGLEAGSTILPFETDRFVINLVTDLTPSPVCWHALCTLEASSDREDEHRHYK